MHLRRALLLFAIVLGLAALVASVSTPVDEPEKPSQSQAEGRATRPDTASRAVVRRFGPKHPRRSLAAGTPATLIVSVGLSGLVEIPSLGLSAPAEPNTPARFDVLEDEPGVHRISFLPAGRDSRLRLGTLSVQAP